MPSPSTAAAPRPQVSLTAAPQSCARLAGSGWQRGGASVHPSPSQAGSAAATPGGAPPWSCAEAGAGRKRGMGGLRAAAGVQRRLEAGAAALLVPAAGLTLRCKKGRGTRAARLPLPRTAQVCVGQPASHGDPAIAAALQLVIAGAGLAVRMHACHIVCCRGVSSPASAHRQLSSLLFCFVAIISCHPPAG